MLPAIRLNSSESTTRFILNLDNVNDLFYDKKTDPTSETQKVQVVLDKYKDKLNSLYFSSESKSREKASCMNREGFCNLAYRTVGIPQKNANEIFSCATDLFSELEGESNDFGLPDAFMTASQFAAGVVRLANIASMINEGMVDTSKLSKQTEAFLSQL